MGEEGHDHCRVCKSQCRPDGGAYFVYEEDGEYKAKQTENAEIEESDTDAATVIQYALDNILDEGGYVELGAFTATLSFAPAADTDDQGMVGQGRENTVLETASDISDSDLFTRKGDDADNRLKNFLLSDLTFDGGGNVADCVDLEHVHHLKDVFDTGGTRGFHIGDMFFFRAEGLEARDNDRHGYLCDHNLNEGMFIQCRANNNGEGSTGHAGWRLNSQGGGGIPRGLTWVGAHASDNDPAGFSSKA
ncbi:hypothetical protein ACFQGT_17975 [Natrialbaceae archaeon GCM10025810]|uniref:hypothetical protein n=1 Tax=Halovalidus salilacus TaxID=3075124 RepID=UPI00361E9130